eukprot:scaffold3036_cov414-Prasinococcus_capsulatus_cf.AAC.21
MSASVPATDVGDSELLGTSPNSDALSTASLPIRRDGQLWVAVMPSIDVTFGKAQHTGDPYLHTEGHEGPSTSVHGE